MKYLILPMQPTPNGRMHIGHGGGTYLRSDILARSLRAEGHEVLVASGTDAYENWILASAKRDGTDPRQSCADYHAGITADLKSLDIEFDVWIDPLSSEHEAAYIALHNEMFERIRNASTVSLDPEKIPYSSADGSPLMGTFIAGECPNCGQSAGGSSCTSCSEHFQPDQLLNPRSRLSDAPIEWQTESNWFVRPADPQALMAHLKSTGLDETHLSVARRYLERSGGRIRLAGPGDWGVPSPELPNRHVLSNSYFLYCMYAARVATGEAALGPFASGSETKVVGVFGTDNSSPGLIVPGLYSQASQGDIKAFDYTVINGMLDLDGQKCSTSKRYGIWLEDAIGGSLLTSSELRYALSGVDLDHGRANLELSKIASDTTRLRELVHTQVAPRVGGGRGLEGIADTGIVMEQRRHLQPDTLDLPAARAVLDLHMEKSGNESLEWAATWLTLAGPFMPSLVSHLRSSADSGPHVGTGILSSGELERVFNRGEQASLADPNGVR